MYEVIIGYVSHGEIKKDRHYVDFINTVGVLIDEVSLQYEIINLAVTRKEDNY